MTAVDGTFIDDDSHKEGALRQGGARRNNWDAFLGPAKISDLRQVSQYFANADGRVASSLKGSSRDRNVILELRPLSRLVSLQTKWQLEPTVRFSPLTEFDRTYSECARITSHTRSQRTRLSNSTCLRRRLSSLNSAILFAVFWFSFFRFFGVFSMFFVRFGVFCTFFSVFGDFGVFWCLVFPAGSLRSSVDVFCFFGVVFGVFKAKNVTVLKRQSQIHPTHKISPGPAEKGNSLQGTLSDRPPAFIASLMTTF